MKTFLSIVFILFSSVPFLNAQCTITILGIGSSTTCLGGASGSGTVTASGSSTGYNYTWLNSTNSVVGTGQVVANLSPGIYTVVVSATGTANCVSATSTISVSSATANSIIELLKPYCGPEAYLGPLSGVGHQWYSGLSPIAGSLGGTAPSYTVVNPVNLSVYWLSYTSYQGCKDSVKFTMVPNPPGNLSASYVSWICSGASNGTAILNMVPAGGSPPGQNSFSVFSTGTTSPYSASVYPTSSNSYTVSGLSAGTYSVKAFDGSCKYSLAFAVVPYLYDFTVSPLSASLCVGNSIASAVSFSSPPSVYQYSYLWSPNVFLAGNAPTYSSTIITPTVAIGTQTTITYTIVVTPSVVNCPLSKTISITVGNPATPLIANIPTLCANSPPFNITCSPLGGIFGTTISSSLSPIHPLTGALTPSLAISGVNTFSYSITLGTCTSVTTATYLINGPNISVAGNRNLCSGNSTTLSAAGADSYTWTNLSQNSTLSLSPLSTTIIGVTGTQTTTGCARTITLQLTVIPTPTLSIAGNFSLCTGKTTVLSATGAQSYTWNTSAISSSIQITPTASVTYTVRGANSGSCISMQTVYIRANLDPTVSVIGPTIVCKGEAATLTASGAHTYTWINQATTPSIIVYPLIINYYYVTGTDTITKCSGFKLVTIPADECLHIYAQTVSTAELIISPNPSSGKFRIENKKALHLILYDQMGKMVLEKDLSEGTHNLDLGELPSGIYYIRTIAHGENYSYKLIKTKE